MVSLCLLTAALATGAVDPPIPAPGCNCGAAQPQTVGVTYYEMGTAPNSNLRDRVRNFLGGQPPVSPYHPIMPVQVAPAVAPVAANAVPVETAPPPESLAVITQRPDYQIPKKYEDKVGHEDDYSWITGHLVYVRADGGRWVVRYGLLDQVDKFGGSVVLAPTVELRNFREGDLVCVFGRVLSPTRTSPALAAPLYQVDSITLVERADP